MKNRLARDNFPPGGIKTLPQNKWVVVKWSEIADQMRDTVWEIYDITYAKIGRHVPDISTFAKKYKILYLIDVDEDIYPDAFIAYKETPHGKKVALIGSDSGRKAKRAMISKMIELAKTPGWYMEASHKVAEILDSAGVPVVTDEATVRDVMGGRDLNWIGEGGHYERALGTSSIVAVKRLFGRPKGGAPGKMASVRRVASRWLSQTYV